MNGFAVGGKDSAGNPGKITVLDMPGYGKGSREEWGDDISKYLAARKELKRAFVLVDSLHGLKKSDEQMLQMLRYQGVPHQVVLSKVDRVLSKGGTAPEEEPECKNAYLESLFSDLRTKIQPKNDGPPAFGQLLACSSEKNTKFSSHPREYRGTIGVNALRWAILVATGLIPKPILMQRPVAVDIAKGTVAVSNDTT